MRICLSTRVQSRGLGSGGGQKEVGPGVLNVAPRPRSSCGAHATVTGRVPRVCKCGRRGQRTRRGVGPTTALASGVRLARAANVDSCQPGWNRIRYASLSHSLSLCVSYHFEWDIRVRYLDALFGESFIIEEIINFN